MQTDWTPNTRNFPALGDGWKQTSAKDASYNCIEREGLTIQQAAKKAGIPPSSLYLYLNGRRPISNAHIWSLFEVLGVKQRVAEAVERVLEE
jgi:predicted transcriptional regulator